MVSISKVKTRAHSFPGAFSGNDASQANGYGDVWQIFVTYDAVFKQTVTSHSGPQARFVYVGRKDHGPWTILEIGTGP